MNKKKMLLSLFMTSFLFVGAFSLFSDSKTDEKTIKTANIEIGDVVFTIDSGLMIPGGEKTHLLSIENNSDVVVDYRITYNLETKDKLGEVVLAHSSKITLDNGESTSIGNDKIVVLGSLDDDGLEIGGKLNLDINASNEEQENITEIKVLVEFKQEGGSWETVGAIAPSKR